MRALCGYRDECAWRTLLAAAITMLTFGCQKEADSGNSGPPADEPPYRVAATTLLDIVRRPDFVSMHRDVVLTCPPEPAASPHSPGRFDDCEVSTIDSSSSLSPLGIKGVRTVRRLSSNRLLVQR